MMDVEKALVYHGQQIEFDISGRVKGIGVISTKYLSKSVKDVDIISAISSAGRIEVAYMIDDKYVTFEMDVSKFDKLNSLVRIAGFDKALHDNGEIDGVRYKRVIFIYNKGALTEGMIRKELS